MRSIPELPDASAFPGRAAAASAALLVLAGLGLRWAPAGLGLSCLGLALLVLNLGVLAALMARTRAFPEEARGWRLLAAYVPLAIVSNALMAWRGQAAGPMGLLDWVGILLHLPVVLLIVLGLLSLPWRGEAGHRRVLAIGAALFGGALGLLLWIAGFWSGEWAEGGFALRMMQVVTFRMALTGGVVGYLLAEDPRRVRGPLGWLLLTVVAGGGAALLGLRLLALHPGDGLPAFAALVLLSPLALIHMVLHRAPAEVPAEAPGLAWPYVDVLLYLPYAGAGAALGALALRGALPASDLLLGFLALTALLLLHQFALFREVRAARDTLELKVRERTRDLEAAQALALRSERMNTMAVLGAGLAHDLNNALAVVHSSIEIIQLDLEEGRVPEARDLELIRKGAERCAGLSQRLMAFGRAQEEQPRAYDLNRLALSSEDLLRMILPSRIQLELKPSRDPLPVHGVPDHMEQVLVNLVGNAKDAIPGQGWIRLELARESGAQGPRARLLVRDSGQGMGPEVLAKLFQPYFTTKEAGRGTGLGLSSTKAILERCGAEIIVESEVGKGTTFTLLVPLEA